MRGHIPLWVMIVVLLGSAALPSSGSRAAESCSDSPCLYLPLLKLRAPVSITDMMVRSLPGARGVFPQVVATVRNLTDLSLCSIEIAYAVRLSGETTVYTGTGTIEMLMPGESKLVILYSRYNTISSLPTVSGEAKPVAWRFERCHYSWLTPVSQTTSPESIFGVRVSGVVRNDTSHSLYDLEVQLSPGTAYTDYTRASVSAIRLEPGATTTYSTELFFAFEPVLPSFFGVRAIGRYD
jgi:hypothetical protein